MSKIVKTIVSLGFLCGIGYVGYQIYLEKNPKVLTDIVPVSQQVHLDEMASLVHDGFSFDHTHYYQNQRRARNKKIQDHGKIYYFDENGDLFHGDIVIKGVPHSFDWFTGAGLDRVFYRDNHQEYWYVKGKRQAYLADAHYKGEWITDRNDKTYWLDATHQGQKALNTICYVPDENHPESGRNLYFDQDGQYYKGWFEKDGFLYHANMVNGDLSSGWTYLYDGMRYFDEENFRMQTGFVSVGDYTYYFDEDSGLQHKGPLVLKVDGQYKNYMFDYHTGAMVGDVKYKNKAMLLFSADTGEWLETKFPNLTYYNQESEPWGSEKVGDFNSISHTGCGPAAGAILLSHYGYNLNPYDMALKMHEWGDYNANYGHGAGSTCFTHLADHYGLKIWKCESVAEMEDALKDGAILVTAVNYKDFTHFHLLVGLSKTGKTTCYDPKVGVFTTTCQKEWDNQSMVDIDRLDYGPIMAISQE